MHAIILAGGYGTRLQAVLPDLPKPMAPIDGRPFLAYLLDYLAEQGVTSVTFAVHYLWETIQDYFRSSYQGISIDYVVEAEPLGTGGAIRNAIYQSDMRQPVFVLNGDTFVKLNYREMYKSDHLLTVAFCTVADSRRYGRVMVENGVIVGFGENIVTGSALINAGVYLLCPDVFNQFDLPEQFSFERDFLMPHLTTLKPAAFMSDNLFIDIGIPEDYARAGLYI